MNTNINQLYHNIQLETNQNTYKRKLNRKQKNAIITYPFDIQLIQYQSIKKDLQRLFPFCYKNTIKTILYKLYLVNIKLNSNIFSDLLNLKLVIYTSSILLDYNIEHLSIKDIYGFFKIRRKVGDYIIDHVHNTIEIKIICNYLLELCLIRSFDIIYSNLSKKQYNTINLESNFFDRSLKEIHEDIKNKLKISSKPKSEYILYERDKIELMIQQYVLDIKSDRLFDSAISKYIFSSDINNNTSSNSRNIIDLSKIDGMYVLSHSVTKLDTAIIVPNHTLYIFLQGLGKECRYYSNIMGNTNLLVVYEILSIISKELNSSNPNLLDIEKKLLKNTILQEIYKNEFRANELKVYLPGQIVVNQSILFNEQLEYTLDTLLEMTEQKTLHNRVSYGIISFKKLLKYNKVYPIEYQEPNNNIILNNNLIDTDRNYKYHTIKNEFPLMISRKTIMGRVLDKDNVYYQVLSKQQMQKEITILDLSTQILETQKIVNKVRETQKEVEDIQEEELKDKYKEKLKYLQEQIFKKGYIEINNKLNICIFSMCRTIDDINSIDIDNENSIPIHIPIGNKGNLAHIIRMIDGHVNYTILIQSYIGNQYIIQITHILDKLYKRIKYTNFPKLTTGLMFKGLLYQLDVFHQLELKDKISFMNEFLRITYKTPKELLFDINDRYQYIFENPSIYKINYYIFLLIQIDLEILPSRELDQLYYYYNRNYMLQYTNPKYYYYKSLIMADYIFLYYLSTL